MADVQTDLPYGPRDRNTMDIYMPDGVETPPVVLFIHGGRWFRNDKTQVQLYDRVEALNAAGLAVAAMNHTYSSEAIWPAQKEDVEAALRYLTDNAAGLGIDADRMGVWGQSSGAHLTLWSALIAAGAEDLDVDAIVAWYAPSDLAALRDDRVADEVPGENERFKEPSPETLLLGASVPDNPDAADALSPRAQIAELPAGIDLPPILLTHGTADFVVSPRQSQRLYDTLQENGHEASLSWVEGGGHGGDGFEAAVPEAVTFFAEHLGVSE